MNEASALAMNCHTSLCILSHPKGKGKQEKGSCDLDLDLDPMTFIYELDPWSVEICRMCKYELPTSRLSKVIV